MGQISDAVADLETRFTNLLQHAATVEAAHDQLAVMIDVMRKQFDTQSAELSATRADRDSIKADRDAMAGAWFDDLRTAVESREVYTYAVASKDAAGVFRELTAPRATLPDLIPPEELEQTLNMIELRAIQLPAQGQSALMPLVAGIRPILDRVKAAGRKVPRSEIVSLVNSVSALGILSSEEAAAVGSVVTNDRDEFHLTEYVKGPTDIRRAMGWADSAQLGGNK